MEVEAKFRELLQLADNPHRVETDYQPLMEPDVDPVRMAGFE
jgi:hypothetical protein